MSALYIQDTFEDASALALGRALDAVLKAGFRLNNLYQSDNGMWIANLRDKDNGYSMGQNHDPAQALLAALASASAGDGEPLLYASGKTQVDRTPTTGRVKTPPNPGIAAVISDDDL